MSRKIRILYIVSMLRTGGAERQLVELLTGLDKNKFLPWVGCIEQGGDFVLHIKKLGIEIEYFQRKWRWDINPSFKIVKFVQRNSIDILHPISMMPAFYAKVASLLTRIPVLNGSIRATRVTNNPTTFLNKILLKSSRYVVANSQAGLKSYSIQESSSKKVIYNGVNLNRFLSLRDPIYVKAALGLTRFSFLVGMVAKLDERKDHDSFIRAASIVHSLDPTIGFLVIGDGNRLATLNQRVAESGLVQNVIFTGNRTDIENLVNCLDVVVLMTSKQHGEGIPNSILEGMALGKCVIVNEDGGIREFLRDGLNGILVQKGDARGLAAAILNVAKDHTFRSLLGRRAQETFKSKFNHTFMIRQFQDFYVKIYLKANFNTPFIQNDYSEDVSIAPLVCKDVYV